MELLISFVSVGPAETSLSASLFGEGVDDVGFIFFVPAEPKAEDGVVVVMENMELSVKTEPELEDIDEDAVKDDSRESLVGPNPSV